MKAHNGFTILAAAIAVAMGVPSCAHTVSGTAVAEQSAASFAPSPTTTANVPTKAPSEMTTDEMVRTMVKEATDYWVSRGVDMSAPKVIEGDTCPGATSVNIASYCEHSLRYTPPRVQKLRDDLGPIAVLEVVAHEIGHAVSNAVGRTDGDNDTWEDRADCASGAVTAEQKNLTLDRAVAIFGRTRTPTRDDSIDAFTTGFNTQRNGGDTLTTCTTYEYK
ncbi:hypothetical protein KIH27_16060 [Mycobacterium sp. M1]|uniref:Metalloprotease n=1 Tax=Mycolicibacter acidiphilus TaxID=2835306 RepID=A0ABS5RNI4_9MYCO|nr:hypothetical protein [Mycolicibacter acidiphilus]MBS9535103.1 hypothetical protein [Mycolicibacter acidiphilus]